MKKIFALFIISIFAFVSCGTDDAVPGDAYDVVVVGAGGGGLAAAARIARAGKKVLVIEQHYKVGGYMGSFKRGDYTFEISLHAMDGLDPETGSWVPMFKDLGIHDKLKPVRMDPMYKAFLPGLSMIVPADALEYKKLLLENFPHEREGIEDFFDAFDRIHSVMYAGSLFIQGEYLAGLWEIVTNPRALGTIASCMNLTMTEVLDDYFKDKALLTVMTAYTCMLGDGPDKIAGMIFVGMWDAYHKGGCYYLKGGSQSIVSALEDVIKQNSGEILLSTRVTKILIKDGKAVGVKTDDGKTFNSKYVVSNANAHDTFLKLVGREYLPEDYVEDLNEMEIGAAPFSVYMGVNSDYSKYFPGESHMLIVMPFANPDDNFRPMREGDITKVGFGITNYTKADPENAPKGKNVIGLVTLMPYDWNNGWMENESRDKYTKFKNEVARKLIKRAEKYLPGLSSHIEELEVGTPRTNVHYTSNTKGSLYGWSHSAEQSLFNRLPQETPIENLILAGAWTFPAGGQTPVLFSGNSAAEIILDDMD